MDRHIAEVWRQSGTAHDHQHCQFTSRLSLSCTIPELSVLGDGRGGWEKNSIFYSCFQLFVLLFLIISLLIFLPSSQLIFISSFVAAFLLQLCDKMCSLSQAPRHA